MSIKENLPAIIAATLVFALAAIPSKEDDTPADLDSAINLCKEAAVFNLERQCGGIRDELGIEKDDTRLAQKYNPSSGMFTVDVNDPCGDIDPKNMVKPDTSEPVSEEVTMYNSAMIMLAQLTVSEEPSEAEIEGAHDVCSGELIAGMD